MPKVRTASEQEERILRENRLEPGEYGVLHSDEDFIRLLCYKTRDDVTIRKGDRPW